MKTLYQAIYLRGGRVMESALPNARPLTGRMLSQGEGERDGEAASVRANARGGDLAYAGVKGGATEEGISPAALSAYYRDREVDGLLVFDLSDDDAEHEANIDAIKAICSVAEMPVIGAGNVKRMEDVKKLLYAGCKKAVLNFKKETSPAILEEVSGKFGANRLLVSFDDMDEVQSVRLPDLSLVGGLMMFTGNPIAALNAFRKAVALRPRLSDEKLPLYIYGREIGGSNALSLLSERPVACICSPKIAQLELSRIKETLYESGMRENALQAGITWEELKKNADGLLPVVVQDYKTDDVLMVAYMNEQAYLDTLRTGKMHYFSRSRGKQWLKGEESGHFQFVKSLTADCDFDTLLAKVSQIGVACHTGSPSCFFNIIAAADYDEKSASKILRQVYDVISDRKAHPKEGSYTNYLFDKGIDKILKKVGEEATETVIAAKNPNPNEITYEISDLLYHLMVLMVQKGVTWEDVLGDLARR